MNTFRIHAALWLLLFLAPFQGYAQAGGIQPISDSDHFRHPMQDRTYSESWNYHFMLDSGESLSVSFAYSNLGLVSGSAAVQLSLSHPGSKPVVFKDKRGQSSYSENRAAGLISIGPHSVVLEENLTRITLLKEEIKANLTIRQWFPGFQTDGGRINVDKGEDGFYRTFIEIPRGDLEGTLEVHGILRTIKGTGYMDHNVTNVLPTSYSSRWYSIRAFFPDYTIVLSEFDRLEKAGGEKWTHGYVAGKEGVLGIWTGSRGAVGYNSRKEGPIPGSLPISMNSGDIKLEGTFTCRETYFRDSALHGLNWFERSFAAALIGNPVVFRCHSRADLLLTTSGRIVHLEGPSYQRVVRMAE